MRRLSRVWTSGNLDLLVENHSGSSIIRIPFFLTRLNPTVLAKKTSKNQLTLPKAIIEHFSDVDYFDVREDGDRILLVPLRPNRADEVRNKLEALGITEADIGAAVRWAREK
jgi:hypothetical protein